MAVMCFNHFNVITGVQRFCGHFEQLKRDIDTYAHIGRHDNGDVFGDFGDFSLLRIRKARCADHGFDAQFATNL